LVIALMAGAAGSASAQLAVQVPTEKLLVLAMTAGPGDSALSIALADAVRDRIGQLAKYKVLVITKAKLCEALTASGFPCDVLLDDQQARQLARFLSVSAYTTGSLTRRDATVVANVRVIDISSSGMPAGFSIANPGTTAAFAEAIAQRFNTIIRASEQVRECTSSRQRGAFPRALSSAQKALTIDSTSAGAWLCIATVYEAQRMPVDSSIAASTRALKGDPCNSAAWENIARGWQQKNDSLKSVEAFIQQLECEPRNSNRRMQIAQLLRQMKRFQPAADLLDAGLKLVPGDQQMLDLKVRICIEASLWKCAVNGLAEQLAHDSALGKDTTFLNTAIGAAQSAPDTQALLRFTEVAVRNYPTSIRFLKARGLHVLIANVLMRQNAGDYPHVRALAAELGVECTIDPTITPKMDGDTSILNLRIGEPELLRVYMDKSLLGDPANEPPPPTDDEMLDARPCSAGHTACYISPYGDVFPCVQFPLPTGNLRAQRFSDVWHGSPQMNEVREIRMRDLPTCSTCSFMTTCTRCPGLAYMEGNMKGPSSADCEKSMVRARGQAAGKDVA